MKKDAIQQITFGRHKAILNSCAEHLARTRHEAALLGNAISVRAKWALLAAVFVPLAIIASEIIGSEFTLWGRAEPELRFPRNGWQVLYEDPCIQRPSCSTGILNDINVSKLPTRLIGKEHSSHVDSLIGKSFWLIRSVPKAELLHAAQLGANHLVLGYIGGSYELYINRSLTKAAHYASSRLPIVFPLQASLFAAPSLEIALHIFHNASSAYPDYLGGASGEGFATATVAENYSRLKLFRAETRPFIFFSLNLLLAILFIALWAPTKRKQEYYYLSIYLLIHAWIQFSFLDIVFRALGSTLTYGLDVVLRFYEGAFGALLALAFARTRRDYFKWGVPAAIAIPLILIVLNCSNSNRLFILNSTIGTYFVPFAYIIGVFVCLIQAAHLYTTAKLRHAIRIRRLSLFALSMSILVCLYVSNAHGISSAEHYVFWYRLVHFLLVLGMALIVASDYRDQELAIERAPETVYHRELRNSSAAQINGFMLTVDLKKSELYFKQRAALEQEKSLVTMWRSLVYSALDEHGGTAIMWPGDQVVAIFDSARIVDPGSAAVRVAETLVRKGSALTQQLANEGRLPFGAAGFLVRAAIVDAVIRPTYEKIEGREFPAWEEAGSTMPFVESSRLLEMEKQIEKERFGTVSRNLIVIKKTQASIVTALNLGWVGFEVQKADKHGSKYELAIFEP
ncbi:MAG TPA: hypothetical protein VJB59_11155 [Bdellovibrionota bacterium]|nr:hypothetical protein [Bdellovibrionota bacterium]